MYVYLVAHETILFIEHGLLTKSKNLCFALKCTIFVQLKKLLTSCMELESRHPYVKYLSNWMILKCLHKLA